MINSLRVGTFQVLAVTHYGDVNIELPHLRFVVHWGLPSSMMTYYHNTAVAGMDGHVARCRMYVTKKSIAYYEQNRDLILKKRNNQENENEKQKYLILVNALMLVDYCTAFQYVICF